ncbi:hypothetical protein U1Q18_029284 [Sarracenia purpurea var. burkii]
MKLHHRIWPIRSSSRLIGWFPPTNWARTTRRSSPRRFSRGSRGSKRWRSSGIARTALGAKLGREISSGEVSSGKGRRRCGVWFGIRDTGGGATVGNGADGMSKLGFRARSEGTTALWA